MKTYLIEHSFVGQESHRNCSILNTDEHVEARIIQKAEDSNCSDADELVGLLRVLRSVAFGTRVPSLCITAIYRIVCIFKEVGMPGEYQNFIFRVVPVFRFDENGNLVSVS